MHLCLCRAGVRAPCRLSGVDASDGQDRCCAGGDDALTARSGEIQAFLGGRDRNPSVSGGNRYERATEELSLIHI